jgi:hypothetical protein
MTTSHPNPFHLRGADRRPSAVRGLGQLAALAAVGVTVTWSITGCAPTPDPGRPAPTTFKTHTANVDRLCDHFAGRTVDQLANTDAEGQATFLAGFSGIPETLFDTVHAYYPGSGGTVRPDNRAEMNRRRDRVLQTCRDVGWVG